MRAFFVALMFLTRIPLPQLQTSKTDWHKSAVFFPLVGFVIGGLLYLATLGLEFLFPTTVTAFLVVLVWIWVTGGLHIDGWMDLADGFGSNRSREQILEIMKDSRVGAMGVIAGICLLAGKWVAVYELLRQGLAIILLISPLVARLLLIMAIRFFPYRKQGGIGEGLRTYLSLPIIILNFTTISAMSYYLLDINGILVLGCTAIFSGLLVFNIYKKLDMLTGDCYGALIEWSEVVFLFVSLAIWRVM
ncbi:adenosylcobinamide-GDP ribazoletransferase [Bacillus sp. 1NLA3E]|uniref:adenosylcobinamide-GDP ribazoletransferase n=1 Tax=Bacillus sp. 1NLA3E TaxID=666686 RepID=UPI000247E93E|nr:adenosylcobinamide-GDP ribazoletransferase [Bacillus sp. 1NLA3E]AGK52178.1 cobalamin (5'-phosphate) synthase [Bacillus sp. 1NLA3E]